ncbi:zinc ribbon domain-containing protein [Janthinobacterium sp. PAMC25594]|uniref:double zinc ribbon domain-containing protein n=1 Tax=Janthinobacterium sp. PAMC25594 TaxID=2861284 RepID=UPI001C6360B6|nr:zinc-ribbon domain-containing protein [Janthinobacterium sp. PAMC25594]QYG05373.1 zinc ribbon domain-containing protein [Janthinobacterium sp. PAMC25594]
MKCLSCQAENKPGAKFCSSCGTTFAVATIAAAPLPGKSCGQCGHDCKADAKFCPKCAFSFAVAPVTAPEPVAVPVENVVAEAAPEPVPVFIPEPVAPPPPVLEKRRADPVPAPAPEPEAIPARVPDSVPDTPVDSPTGGNRMKLIGAAVAVVVLLGGAGAYYFLSGKPPVAAPESAPSSPGQEDAASAAEQPLAISDPVLDGAATADFAATPAAAADEPAPVPEAVPVPAPEPAPEPAPAPVAEKPAKPVKVTPPAAPVNKAAGLESVITESLSEASHCMSQRKYDCAIANANAVLRMDKGNRYALDIKRKAKDAQDKALSQIQIE